MEKPFFFENNPLLFGMVFTPNPDNQKSCGFLIIHPFAEEKKSSHRTLVELARAIVEIGFPVLMVDLRGCGDSGGTFATVRLNDWLKDLDKSIQQFNKEVSINKVCILGLRFGAYLSLCYAVKYKKIKVDLIWIEPVLSPITYLKKSLRHKLIKELCTEGNIISNRDSLLDDLGNNKGIDFDGYEISSLLYLDLVNQQKKQLIIELLPKLPIKLLVSVSMSGRLSKSYQNISSIAPNVEIKSIKMELFWNKVDDIENGELIKCISDYIKEEYIYE